MAQKEEAAGAVDVFKLAAERAAGDAEERFASEIDTISKGATEAEKRYQKAINVLKRELAGKSKFGLGSGIWLLLYTCGILFHVEWCIRQI